MNEYIYRKIKYAVFLFILVTCLFFRADIARAYDAPVVISNAENGKIYTDIAEIVFYAKGSTAQIYTNYKCVYTDASGMSACIEDCVTVHEESEVYITRAYSVEGIYDIEFSCTDLNGAISDIMRVSIAVDSSAPEINFANVENGKIYKNGFELYVEVREMFYDLITVDIDASVTVDGEETKLIVPYDVQATANKNIYKFEGSGKYRLNVTAKDESGHTSSKKLEFTIDSKPPDISIKNENMLLEGEKAVSKAPDFFVSISDELSGKAEGDCVLAKKEGSVYKEIKSLKLKDGMTQRISLDGEGIYTLKVSAVDGIGNKIEKVVDITLDKTPPIIGYISDFNEKYLNSFTMPENFKVYIQDLTDTVFKAYLNSKLLPEGETVHADGKYILQVMAEDLAGNSTEEMIAFIIDNTCPKIIVNGIDKSGNVQDDIIRFTLLDSDDYFESATINGETLTFDPDRKELNIMTEAYETDISVTAKDFAGNETVETIKARSAFGAFDTSGMRKEMKTLTKNSKNNKFFSWINSGLGFWIFCGILFIAAVIFLVFALFDIKNISW